MDEPKTKLLEPETFVLGEAKVNERLSENEAQGLLDALPPTGKMNAQPWLPPTVEELQLALPQYEVTDLIARGGMGAVYKGTQRSLRRTVAIKVLPPEVEDGDMHYSERFKREAQSMAQLSHPNIVAVYDAGETPHGLLYFVMEFIEGTDLAQLINSRGRIDPSEAIRITMAVCEALGFAHDGGIIHRDIKPSNIMLDKRGHVKVADFGLAKTINVESTLLTRSNMAMGTTDFIAPEALVPGTTVDGRADLYAVGVMLYQMLIGKIPRGRFALPSVLNPKIDRRLDVIVDKAMQTDRENRYANAREMKTDVEVISALIQSHPAGSVPKPAARVESPVAAAAPSKKPKKIGIIATAAVLLSGAWFALPDSSPIKQSTSLPDKDKMAASLNTLTTSAEPWQDALLDPLALTIIGGVKQTTDGLLFSDKGYATYYMNLESKRDGAVRMLATFGGTNPALRARVSVSDGVYEVFVKDAAKLTLSCYNSISKSLSDLRVFTLPAPLQPGQNYELELRTVGEVLTVKFNGQTLGTVTDATLEKGRFGIGISEYNGTPALVKAMQVLDLDAP